MPMPIRPTIAPPLLLWLLAAGLCAQSPGLRPLSLRQARQEALERNWDLLAARSDVAQADASRILSKELPNPSLSLSAGKIPSDGSPASTARGNRLWDRSYESTAAVTQLLELGGKRKQRQESAASGLAAARARFEDARRLLDGAVVKAYTAAVLAEENAAVLAGTAESLRQSARIAEARFQAGDISESERRQVEVAAARFETDASAASAAARSARVALDLLLGDPQPAGTWHPSDDLAGVRTLVTAAPRAGAAARRPDLVAGDETVRKAEADLRLQKAQVVPDLNLSFLYDRQPPDQPNTVGLGIGITLPLWNRNRGAIAQATATLDQAKHDRDRLEAKALAEQAAARVAYESAQARHRRFAEDILPKSGKVHESVAYAYQHGSASLLELLEAERSAADLRLAAAQAQADEVAAGVDLSTALNQPIPLERP